MTAPSPTGSVLVKGALWLMTGSGSIAAVSLVVSALLARLLPGDEFGTAVLLLTTVAVLQMFSELGLAVAIVQRRDLDDVTRDNVFYLSTLFALVIAAVLLFAGERLTAVFDAPGLASAIPLIAVLLVLRTLYSVYRSLMLRDMSFRRIAVFDVAGHVAYAGTAIALAAGGLGPNAVLIGQLISNVLLLGAVVVTTRVVPRSRASFTSMRSLLGFGFWVAANRVLSRAAGHIDKFVIASVLSPVSLGAYFIAQQLIWALPDLVNGTVNQVTLPAYARIQNDLRLLEERYWQSLRYTLLIVFPTVALIASHADWLVVILYGPDWSSAARIMRILGLGVLLATAGGSLFATVLYAVGRSREVMWSSTFRAVVLPLSVLIGARYGVEGVAWASVAYVLLVSVVNLTILKVVLGFSPRRLIIELLRPLAIAIVTYSLSLVPMNTPGAIAAVTFVQLLIIVIVVRVVYRELFDAVVGRVVRRFSRRGAG